MGLGLVAAMALAFAFYYVDHTGKVETIEAVVVEMGAYTDRTDNGPHNHAEAVLQYEGHRCTVRPADNLRSGQTVRVEVRRGRITGYPYFVAALGARANH